MSLKKFSLVLILIFISVLFLASFYQIQTKPNHPTSELGLTANITSLNVTIQSAMITYYTKITINNPFNTDITLNQPTSCGYEVGKSFYFSQPTSYQSSFYSVCQENPINITYNPGKTIEYYNASETFRFQGTLLTTLPDGFYYFYPLDTNFSSSGAISSALYVKYADNSSVILYNVPFRNEAPYGYVAITQQLTMFKKAQNSLLNSSNSSSSPVVIPAINISMNNFLGIILVILIPIGFIYYLFNVRLKKKQELKIEVPVSEKIEQREIFFDHHKIESQTAKNAKVCKSCLEEIAENDQFCANCGMKV